MYPFVRIVHLLVTKLEQSSIRVDDIGMMLNRCYCYQDFVVARTTPPSCVLLIHITEVKQPNEQELLNHLNVHK